jgi:hypothetical protein
VAGGWFMTSGGSSGFLEVWSNLDQATPTRIASAIINSPGTQADWVMDNAVDTAGNIYAVGYTSGRLQNSQLGNGDAYIVKFSTNLTNPVYKQVGTSHSDAFRRMEIDSSGNLYAVGYTYGNYGGVNADSSLRTGDVLVEKFSSSLVSLGQIQFGSAGEDRGFPHLRGTTLYLGGMTEGALAAANSGTFDAFTVRVDTNTLVVK